MHDFVETWKAIAHAMDRSERWCRYMAARPSNPLPVFKVGGIVRLNLADRDAWIATQRVQTMRVIDVRITADDLRLSA